LLGELTREIAEGERARHVTMREWLEAGRNQSVHPIPGVKEFDIPPMESVYSESTEAVLTDGRHIPLSQDAALVVALAGTAIPFAHSAEDEAERWLRAMRLHGQVGSILQALGVGQR